MRRFTIDELNKGYSYKEFSPVEITKMYLKEIKEKNPIYNAFITITEENALNQAKYLEEKMMTTNDLGKMFGVPISFKDNIETKNILTTNGSVIDRKNIPKVNAPIVQMMNNQDAIILGKNNLHEFAFGITSNNPHYGAVKNPWNTDFTPGGSSGGSAAAVAANQSIVSFGTDTGASIRVPAASCGVIGLKPTKGRVPTKNVTGISWTLDHVGPIAANMMDLAIVTEPLLKVPFLEESKKDIKGLKVGIPKNYFNEKVNEESYTLYQESLKKFEELGAILIEVDIPDINDNSEIGFIVALSETSYLHKYNIENKFTEYGEDVQQIMANVNSFSAYQYIMALERIKQYINEFKALFNEIDVLATLTMPSPPQKIGVDGIVINSITENLFQYMCKDTYIFNMIGFPAISIPCGLTKNGLPVGLQLVALPDHEKILFKTGFSFEKYYLQDFYKKRHEILSLNNNILK